MSNGPYGGPPPAYGDDQPPVYGQLLPKPRNGAGVAALVLGVVAILLCWIPVLNVILGILAIIFGIVGWRRGRRNNATNPGVAMTGIVLGILGLIASIVLVVIVAAVLHSPAFQRYQHCIRSASTQSEQQHCIKRLERHYGVKS